MFCDWLFWGSVFFGSLPSGCLSTSITVLLCSDKFSSDVFSDNKLLLTDFVDSLSSLIFNDSESSAFFTWSLFWDAEESICSK